MICLRTFFSFKSGSIPRQVGGNRQVVYDRGARQEGNSSGALL